MASYLITGASRGLGLELARQLSSLSTSEVSKVFAAARGDAPALDELAKGSSGRIVVIKLDAANEASIKQAAVQVEANLDSKGLDVLINNAGILQYAPKGVNSIFTTNVLGVHWVTRAFLPLLQKGSLKKVVNISSTIGSIAPSIQDYQSSSDALTVQYALDYEKEGFTIVAFSPGWLRTNLSSETADLSVEQGAKASLEKTIGAGKERNGQFMKIEIKGWEKVEGRNQYGVNVPL
ncbi:short chain dehydrogenase reductase [Acephala macrosclerotiorum]|nr:short chain dehydrogenase reductase [Acephala macrosclerotiorum]